MCLLNPNLGIFSHVQLENSSLSPFCYKQTSDARDAELICYIEFIFTGLCL